MTRVVLQKQGPVGSQSGLKSPDFCGSEGALAAPQGLPRRGGRGKLDPDMVAFVEALARYAARRDHEAQSGEST
jgi:hypothetical protein